LNPKARRPARPVPPTYIAVLHEFLNFDLGLRSIREEEAPVYVLDYIAGMTDAFFLGTFSEMFRTDLDELFSASHGVRHSVSIPTLAGYT